MSIRKNHLNKFISLIINQSYRLIKPDTLVSAKEWGWTWGSILSPPSTCFGWTPRRRRCMHRTSSRLPTKSQVQGMCTRTPAFFSLFSNLDNIFFLSRILIESKQTIINWYLLVCHKKLWCVCSLLAFVYQLYYYSSITLLNECLCALVFYSGIRGWQSKAEPQGMCSSDIVSGYSYSFSFTVLYSYDVTCRLLMPHLDLVKQVVDILYWCLLSNC